MCSSLDFNMKNILHPNNNKRADDLFFENRNFKSSETLKTNCELSCHKCKMCFGVSLTCTDDKLSI